MADVEEEVCRPLVVAVLEQLRERELEHVLIEGDRCLDVTREEREVMETGRRRLRAIVRRLEMPRPHGSPLFAAIDGSTMSGHRISSSVCGGTMVHRSRIGGKGSECANWPLTNRAL